MQAHTDASLRRFLRAFIDVDVAFKQLLKCNKWRREYKVTTLSPEDPDVAEEMATGKVHILRDRDNKGRSVAVWGLSFFVLFFVFVLGRGRELDGGEAGTWWLFGEFKKAAT